MRVGEANATAVRYTQHMPSLLQATKSGLRQFRLLFSVLVAGCLLIACDAYAAAAGKVVSASGTRQIVSPTGQARIPSAGAQIDSGETAVTGGDGQLTIRFSDDTTVQLHAKSTFKVEQYAFSGQKDTKAKGFFSLVKGGFRTVTGLIGKLNPSAYRVSTPAATIGIRGTEYSARLDNGLHVSVERGEILLANRAGKFPVAKGQRAYVSDQRSAPRYLTLNNAVPGGGDRNDEAGGVQVHGNTQVNASARDSNAVAVGQGNAAGNRVGTLGGK